MRRHTVRQPLRWYWPSASSMKNSGRPPSTSMMQYGTRNAPDTEVEEDEKEEKEKEKKE